MSDEHKPNCEMHTLRIENLEHDMSNVKHAIYGVDGRMGISQMLSILWRAHVIWPMMFIGMILGSALTILVSVTIKHL